MSYNFDYDYFNRREDDFESFFDDDEYEYEFSDELFPDDNRYTGEYDDYDY